MSQLSLRTPSGGTINITAEDTAVSKTLTLPAGAGNLALETDGLLTNPTVTNYTETVYEPAAGTSFTIDLSLGVHQIITTTGNATITLPAAVSGKSFIIEVRYGGVHTITWAGGSAIRWPKGTPPFTISIIERVDVFVFLQRFERTYGSVFAADI